MSEMRTYSTDKILDWCVYLDKSGTDDAVQSSDMLMMMLRREQELLEQLKPCLKSRDVYREFKLRAAP